MADKPDDCAAEAAEGAEAGQPPRRRSLLPEGSPRRLGAALALVAASALAVLVLMQTTPLAQLAPLELDRAAQGHGAAAEVSRVAGVVEEGQRAADIAEAQAEVDDAVAAFADAGYDVGYVVAELDGSWEASHADDLRCYSASSIKGPFLVSLFRQIEERGDVPSEELRDTASEIIVWSDNESYSALRERTDGEGFRAWLAEAGVDEDAAEHLTYNWYGPISARDLAGMWKLAAAYLESGSDGARHLADLLAQPEVSAIRKLAGDGVETWSKAGWYPEEGEFGSSPSTCEGGVIRTEDGSYVMAVVSNAPEKFELLDDLVRALANLRLASK